MHIRVLEVLEKSLKFVLRLCYEPWESTGILVRGLFISVGWWVDKRCRDDDDDDGRSEVSSTSQNSYDPLHPVFHDRDGEIGSVSSGVRNNDQPSNVVLITRRVRPDPSINILFDRCRAH